MLHINLIHDFEHRITLQAIGDNHRQRMVLSERHTYISKGLYRFQQLVWWNAEANTRSALTSKTECWSHPSNWESVSAAPVLLASWAFQNPS